MMTLSIPAFLTVIVLFVASCAAPESPSTRELQPRFKGVELYSWKSPEGAWVFSLMDGTNRAKFAEDVKHSNVIKGVEALSAALSQLAVGEQVFWSHHAKGFEYPSAGQRALILESAQESGIEMSIAEDFMPPADTTQS